MNRRILKEIEPDRTSIDHALAYRRRLYYPDEVIRFVEGDFTGEIPSDRDQQVSIIEGE